MKLSKGKYVRTKNGEIGKIRTIIDNMVFINANQYYSTVVKESDKLEDLLEPADLMYIDISPDNYGGIVVPRVAETQNELDKWKQRFASGECILKGVLTKEQIINNWYIVGE